jgi:hypothetical protein
MLRETFSFNRGFRCNFVFDWSNFLPPTSTLAGVSLILAHFVCQNINLSKKRVLHVLCLPVAKSRPDPDSHRDPQHKGSSFTRQIIPLWNTKGHCHGILLDSESYAFDRREGHGQSLLRCFIGSSKAPSIVVLTVSLRIRRKSGKMKSGDGRILTS